MKKSNLKTICLILILTFFVTQKILADTHYVNVTNQSASSPFTSWETAATNIQDAVDMANNGDTVLVTDGIYNIGGDITPGYSCSNRVVITKNILVKSVNGRNKTIISGASDPINSGNNGNGANAVRCVYLTGNAVLTGFTLSNGFTDVTGGWPFLNTSGGGAVLNNGGIISNCIIKSSIAYESGGGIYGYKNGTVENCIIQENRAPYGGGFYFREGCVAENCVIQKNESVYSGGGAYCYYGMIKNSVIKLNYANGNGSGAYCHYGQIQNSTIKNNTAYWSGGGVLGENNILVNSLITGNEAYSGGGIFSYSNSVIHNCTISDNFANYGGGLYSVYGCSVRNSIIYYNHAYNGIEYFDEKLGTIISFEYCNTTPTNGFPNFVECFDDDPEFVNINTGNYRLFESSPCIDVGNNAYAVGNWDLDGNQRILDGTIELGAYEFVPEPCAFVFMFILLFFSKIIKNEL